MPFKAGTSLAASPFFIEEKMVQKTSCPFNDIPKELAEKWRNRLEEIGQAQTGQAVLEESLSEPPYNILEYEGYRTKLKCNALVTICKWFSVTGATVYLVHKGLLEAIAWFVRR